MSEVADIQREIFRLKKELSEAYHRQPLEPVGDFSFDGQDGPVRFSELFGDRPDLLILHNMGKTCSYCSLWADGLNGQLRHILERAAFVAVSPDRPEVQREFAAQRGWNFTMVSDATLEFSRAMGMVHEESDLMPGISAFHRDEDGSIRRVGWTFLGPGDDFCPVWPLFDLLKGGAGDWEPS